MNSCEFRMTSKVAERWAAKNSGRCRRLVIMCGGFKERICRIIMEGKFEGTEGIYSCVYPGVSAKKCPYAINANKSSPSLTT